MSYALLIDFGSTFTKLTAVNLTRPKIAGQAQAPTTVDTDVARGFDEALGRLSRKLGGLPRWEHKLACSSAAGGLRVAAIGLVPELTAEAARRAALGAGARVVGVFGYIISPEDLIRLSGLEPDMVLLAGGTDGGNREILLQNARILSPWRPAVPFVVAGNEEVSSDAARLLAAHGRPVTVTANVMPRLGRLNVEPARRAIRRLFMERIVHARGMSAMARRLDGILMPTPAAVLQAARTLADGTADEEGWGPLAVVDVGGATTDVHSVSAPGPFEPGVRLRGLEEPYAGRTVEGDLGLRYSAPGILEQAGTAALASAAGMTEEEVKAAVKELACRPDTLPRSRRERSLEKALAVEAVKLGLYRHAGRIFTVAAPAGTVRFQEGKDLRPVKRLIATGGFFRVLPEPDSFLRGIDLSSAPPGVRAPGTENDAGRGRPGPPLLPRKARWWVDRGYLFAAMGLLAERFPGIAAKLLKESLMPVSQIPGGDDIIAP